MGLSLRAYAAHRKGLGLSGGTLQAVQKAIKSGRITLRPDGTIDPVVADAQWLANTSEAKRIGRGRIADQPQQTPAPALPAAPLSESAPLSAETRSPQPADGSLSQAQRELVLKRVEDKELDLGKKRGELVSITDTEHEVGELITDAKNRLLLVPSKICDQVAASRDAAECQSIMEREIRLALEEVSRWNPRKQAA